MSSLGIDIGGANLKVASEEGWEVVYFPMWKKAGELEKVLGDIAKKYSARKAGVVMTAELADIFRSKEEGVRFIGGICEEVFDEVFFLDVNGRLSKALDNPSDFAASNWVASAAFLLQEGYRNFLFVDMGSTTTDIIPVTDRIEAAKTDYERLKRGEMIYFGILRTPVFYILREFDSVPLCPEFFAITADVFAVTGDITSEEYTCETPDGKGRDEESCLRRLARTVCCDLEELGVDRAKQVALEAKKAMKDWLEKAVEAKADEYGLRIVFACGIGEFLIEEACNEIDIECSKLSSLYGDYSKLFPAFAMLKLVQNE
ncbi:hydantoinase/oxoprolinase family protein [Archaeoglobus sp.]